MLGESTVCGMMEFSFSFTVTLLLCFTSMSRGSLIEQSERNLQMNQSYAVVDGQCQ